MTLCLFEASSLTEIPHSIRTSRLDSDTEADRHATVVDLFTF